MLWTNDYLNSLILEAEIDIASKVPCIIDRYGLSTEQYINSYLLPDYIDNIRRVFWKGFRLDPVGTHELYDWPEENYDYSEGAFQLDAFQIDAFDTGGITGAINTGRPTQYYYNTFGENVIRFDRGSNETIVSGQSDLFTSAIPNAVIIEYYRIPDGINHTIPTYIRRRTIKAYVLYKAFAKEGDGQNLEASVYWKNKYELLINKARTIINSIHKHVIVTRDNVNNTPRHQLKPARPVLPWNYGIPVQEEDW